MFITLLGGLAKQKGLSAYVEDGANHWAAVNRLDAGVAGARAITSDFSPGARFRVVAEEAIPFRRIAEAIGEKLGLPARSILKERATEPFTWFAHFASMNGAASSTKTRELLRWTPSHLALLPDIIGVLLLAARVVTRSEPSLRGRRGRPAPAPPVDRPGRGTLPNPSFEHGLGFHATLDRLPARPLDMTGSVSQKRTTNSLMTQRPKPEVREAIQKAAAEAFADGGFERATLSDIVERAGTSIGNLYKYFANKEELFEDFIPRGFTTELTARLRAQVEALRSEPNVLALSDAQPYRRASEDLLAFTLAHRARVIFLLLRAQGTKHERFANAMVRLLVQLAIEHAHTLSPTFAVTPATKRTLTRIYRSFVATLGTILVEERADQAVREAVAWHATYHLSGLAALFRAAPTRQASR